MTTELEIAQKAAELAALEEKAEAERAERAAQRRQRVTIKFHLPGKFMKALAAGIEDLEDKQAFSRALDAWLDREPKRQPRASGPMAYAMDLHRGTLPGHVMLRNAGQLYAPSPRRDKSGE